MKKGQREEKKHSNVNEPYKSGKTTTDRVTMDRQPGDRRLQQSP